MVSPPELIPGACRCARSRHPFVLSTASFTSSAVSLNFHYISFPDFPTEIIPFIGVGSFTMPMIKLGDSCRSYSVEKLGEK